MAENSKPKVGILPLMLEMYSSYAPQIPRKQKGFINEVKENLNGQLDILTSPICTTDTEVRKAIRIFIIEDVELIIVLFISYAKSFSCLKGLLETSIPILMFSTSPKNGFGDGFTMDDILMNHGVHGYMDLANVLNRFGKKFVFVSGQKNDGAVIGRIIEWARVASAFKKLKRAKIGIAGYTFDGMGDLGVDTTTLYGKIGPELIHIPLDLIAERLEMVSEEEIKKEIEVDLKIYERDESVSDDILWESERLYLAIKSIIDESRFDGFTMHFQGILENPNIKTVPFLGISKLQKKGIIYAGEGDVLGVTGGLILKFLGNEVLFAEPFCPDFNGKRLLMSHMGESNPSFGKKVVLKRKKFTFGKILDPVVMDVEVKEGEVTFINFGIEKNNYFQVVVFSGEVVKRIKASRDVDMPYFFMKPQDDIPVFLTKYSRCGVSHHLSMSPGNKKELIGKMAYLLDINYFDLDLMMATF